MFKGGAFKIPKSFKLKMMIGGSAGCGKSSFLLGKPVIERDFNQLGVSFKPIECVTNEEDSFKFIVWDLKTKERFRFLYPIFCKGICSALLCFDVSNYESFKELPYWIKIVRDNKKTQLFNIPIVLIGTKRDLKNHVVLNEDVNKLVENYKLDGVFYTSIHDSDRKEKKEAIFKHLIERISPFYQIHDFHLIIPKDDEKFREFIDFYSICPICKNKNHFESLKSFYYSRVPGLVEMKKRLLELMEESKDYDEIYYNKISLGIPCCSCFKKYFNE